MPRLVAALLLLAGLVALSVLAGVSVAAQQTHQVETEDNFFDPDSITVRVGDTVTFVNTGRLPHTATADDGSFDTGNLDAGESESVTFSTAGRIPYTCIYHEALGMVGTIIVEEGDGALADGAPAEDPEAAPAPEGPSAAETEDLEAQLPLGVRLFPLMALGMGVVFMLGLFGAWVRGVLRTTGSP